jgi:hypothetical protein
MNEHEKFRDIALYRPKEFIRKPPPPRVLTTTVDPTNPGVTIIMYDNGTSMLQQTITPVFGEFYSSAALDTTKK